ncbi:hypothetical protein Taro_025760, partial [Colocasia esculenta]|nr:hypothetical protein [Colocasia esculenta]
VLTCSHGAVVGPFVRDCETERLFLCCVVRVGYWPDQPVVRCRVVASFLSDSCFAIRRARYSVTCYGTGLLVVSVLVPCGNSLGVTVVERTSGVKLWILTRVGYGSVLVLSALDINSRLASRGNLSLLLSPPSPLLFPHLYPCASSLLLAVDGSTWEGRDVCSIGPFVRDYETERLFLCCVVRVGYWPDQPVVRCRVVASFLSDSCFAIRRGLYLYPVWVMICGGTSYTSLSGVDVELCFVEVVCLGVTVVERTSGVKLAMASRGRRGAHAREDEPRREERNEQQALAPQGPSVLPPPPPVDYGVFMQGLVQAMQTQAHTQAALQA